MTKQINTIKDVNVGDVFYYYEADTRYRKPRSVAVVAVDKKYITVDVGGGVPIFQRTSTLLFYCETF